jgi:NADH-quinone oxidoreductase subunit K
MTNLLALSFFLFLVGTLGMFLYRRHFIIILISLELLLLAINLQFIIFSVYLDELSGQLFCLLSLTVAAAESSLGLAILIVFYRLRGGIAVDLVNLLKA